MSVKVVFEKVVSNCEECPFSRRHYGHGENWKYCSHKESPDGYGNIIDKYPRIPLWCPFVEES